MKISFGGGNQARDHIIDYLQTNKCMKRKSSTVKDHVHWINHIIQVANQVQGTINPINQQQALKIIKNTMPRNWQANFSISGLSIKTCTQQDLINYFAQQKRTADYTDVNTTLIRIRYNCNVTYTLMYMCCLFLLWVCIFLCLCFCIIFWYNCF